MREGTFPKAALILLQISTPSCAVKAHSEAVGPVLWDESNRSAPLSGLVQVAAEALSLTTQPAVLTALVHSLPAGCELVCPLDNCGLVSERLFRAKCCREAEGD